MFKTLTALVLIDQVAATYSEGGCPKINTVKPFDAKRYVGEWYEIARDSGPSFEWGAECTTAHYTLRSDGDIDVTNRAWYWYYFGQYFGIHGKARCPAD